MSDDTPPRRGPTPASWKPGQSGNPGGMPVGAKRSLSMAFMKALAQDFNENGPSAIAEFRTKDPGGYCNMLARLIPVEANLNVNNIGSPKELTDEQIMKILSEPIEGEATLVIDVPALSSVVPPGLN